MGAIENRFVRLRGYISGKEGKPLTCKDLAALLGISPPVLSRIETGARPPTNGVALKFHKKFGIDPSWFLYKIGPDPWGLDLEKADLDLSAIQKNRQQGCYPETEEEYLKETKAAIKELLGWPKFASLADFIIEAGRDLRFRSILYNVLEGGFDQTLYDLKQAHEKIKYLRLKIERGEDQLIGRGRRIKELEAELKYERAARSDLAEKLADFEVPTPELRPDTTRKAADSKLTFESTVLEFKIPAPPKGMRKPGRDRWERNAKTLNRWQAAGAKNWPATVPPPPWAIEKFCREAVGLYRGGKLGDIGGLLWSFIEEVGV